MQLWIIKNEYTGPFHYFALLSALWFIHIPSCAFENCYVVKRANEVLFWQLSDSCCNLGPQWFTINQGLKMDQLSMWDPLKCAVIGLDRILHISSGVPQLCSLIHFITEQFDFKIYWELLLSVIFLTPITLWFLHFLSPDVNELSQLAKTATFFSGVENISTGTDGCSLQLGGPGVNLHEFAFLHWLCLPLLCLWNLFCVQPEPT